jgi:hypothetical protein
MPDDRLRDAVLLLVGQRPPHATQRLQALPQPELDREVQVVGCRPRGRRLEQNENWSQGQAVLPLRLDAELLDGPRDRGVGVRGLNDAEQWAGDRGTPHRSVEQPAAER